VQAVAVSHKAPELELVAVEVSREEQSVFHRVQPLQLLSVRQAEELFQQTREDALTHQEHLVAVVKVVRAISFVQE
jgi:hypothetical protein